MNMIKVYYGDNVNRTPTMVENTTPIHAFMDAHGMDRSRTTQMSGTTLRPEDMNKTFADFGFGVGDGATTVVLTTIAKLDNA